MPTSQEQLNKLIETSDLSETDKANITQSFSNLPDQLISGVVELFQEDPRFIPIINKLLKAKTDAFATQDEAKLAEILRQEKELMDKISQEK